MAMPTKDRKTLTAPTELCIYNQSVIKDTFQFFDDILIHAIRKGQLIHLDLSSVKKMMAGAALRLFSEVSAAQIATKTGEIISVTAPSEPQLANRFVDTGLTMALKKGTVGRLQRLWKTGSDFQSGTNPADCIIPTRNLLKRNHQEPPQQLITAISEAMLNTTQHAYREFKDVQPDLNGRWWQYCFVTHNVLHFLISDFGLGIPSSLRINKVMPAAAPLLNAPQPEDKDLIAHAMKKGISRLSGQGQGRGQGSEDMKRPASRSNDSLLIISGNGHYLFSVSDDVPQLKTLPFSIRGTFIEWSLEMNQ
jgi:anti-sigma regulatory factor (Ser/Thr protein kinase)